MSGAWKTNFGGLRNAGYDVIFTAEFLNEHGSNTIRTNATTIKLIESDFATCFCNNQNRIE